MRFVIEAMLALFISGGVSWAAGLKDENFMVGVPEGYKVVYSARQQGLIVKEMVPNGQSLENWRDMVTIQVHLSNERAGDAVR